MTKQADRTKLNELESRLKRIQDDCALYGSDPDFRTVCRIATLAAGEIASLQEKIRQAD